MKISYMIIPMLAMATLMGCKQNPAPALQEATVPEAPASEQTVEEEPQEAQPVTLVPVIRDAKPVRAVAKTTTAAKTPAKKEKGETIYVETDGAQGRVWGHVTMYGDRGNGTIHDWDENTWAVNVTRHGDELYATDQNSRLYVFKLKQNKTQE